MSKAYVIAQGGGPTAVINQTVAGAALAIRKRDPAARILGARHGVRGIRDGHFIDLSALSEKDLHRLGDTPNAALGSTRDKPDEAYCGRILESLRSVSAGAFIYIGGNDTAGTLQILAASAGDDIADHGNVQLSTGDLGIAVQAALSRTFPKVRARVDTFGYLIASTSAPMRSRRRRAAVVRDVSSALAEGVGDLAPGRRRRTPSFV
jgi:hypothetical protein